METKKALTFRASSIGDCLMGKYLLENIHARYPRARLGVVVASRAEMIRDLFAAYPWLEVIEANRRSPRALLSLLKNFYRSDLVVTQYAGKPGGSFGLASKLFARILAKHNGLIGFTDASFWNRFLYDKLVPVSSNSAIAEHDRAALRAMGLSVSLPFPSLECVRDGSVLAKFNLEALTFAVIHLFAGNKGRGLHPDKKRELLAALSKKLPDTQLVITGGADDREEALRVSEDLPVTVVAGKATLQEIMNIIKHSRGVVSVDTGMAHIAAQLHKPLVVIRTCVGRNWWLRGQYSGDEYITVFDCDAVCKDGHLTKDYPACMDAVNMEEVAEKVSTI